MGDRPNYRTAPLKAISRHMIVEICRRLVVFGELREYVYVGMGGLEFVDFELFHRTLGVETMYSIEAVEPQARLEFNRPYDKIQILHGRSSDVLTDVSELGTARSIVWLDYTDSLTQSELADISYVASKMTSGSALFVTVNCHFDPKYWDRDRVAENFGEYFDSSLPQSGYTLHGLGDQQLLTAEMALKRALDLRVNKTSFERVLDIRYKDSARMQVFGWIISGETQTSLPSEMCRLSELDFTPAARDGEALHLSWPDLTNLEWDSIARQLPVRESASLSPPHETITPETLRKFVSIYRFSRLERLYS